jgi:hypothetical protein
MLSCMVTPESSVAPAQQAVGRQGARPMLRRRNMRGNRLRFKSYGQKKPSPRYPREGSQSE